MSSEPDKPPDQTRLLEPLVPAAPAAQKERRPGLDGPLGMDSGKDAHDVADRLTSEPLVLAIALGIFLLFALAMQWETVWDALVKLIP